MNIEERLLAFQATRVELEDEPRLEALLTGITVREVVALLSKLQGDPIALERAAAHAYLHTNGFKKVTLFRSPDLCLRLHFWEDGTPRAENIHSHKWTFASRVLYGTVTESRFEASDGDNGSVFEYVKPKESLTGDLVAAGPIGIALTGTEMHREDELYTMTSSELHRVDADPGGAPLGTLVLTGPSLQSTSKVYALGDLVPKPDSPNAMLSLEETDALITDARGKLT